MTFNTVALASSGLVLPLIEQSVHCPWAVHACPSTLPKVQALACRLDLALGCAKKGMCHLFEMIDTVLPWTIEAMRYTFANAVPQMRSAPSLVHDFQSVTPSREVPYCRAAKFPCQGIVVSSMTTFGSFYHPKAECQSGDPMSHSIHYLQNSRTLRATKSNSRACFARCMLLFGRLGEWSLNESGTNNCSVEFFYSCLTSLLCWWNSGTFLHTSLFLEPSHPRYHMSWENNCSLVHCQLC